MWAPPRSGPALDRATFNVMLTLADRCGTAAPMGRASDVRLVRRRLRRSARDRSFFGCPRNKRTPTRLARNHEPHPQGCRAEARTGSNHVGRRSAVTPRAMAAGITARRSDPHLPPHFLVDAALTVP